MEQETIVRAAVMLDSGALFLGRRHCECIAQAIRAGAQKPIRQAQQGFLTSKGRFVSRSIAAMVAHTANQTSVEKHPLTSEDLW